MKRYNILSLCALCLFALTGCDHGMEIGTDAGQHSEVRFAGSIGAMTRASGTSWSPTDRIGISDKDQTRYINKGYKYNDGTASSGNFVPIDDNDPIYWETTGWMDFIAYYPYNAGMTVENPGLTANTDNQADKASFDFLYGEGKGTLANQKNGPVVIRFNHRMARLVLTVRPGKGFTMDDLKTARYSLTNFRENGEYLPLTGVAEATGDIRTDAWDITGLGSQTDDGIAFDLILFPQEFKGKKMQLAVTIGESALTADIDFTLTVWNGSVNRMKSGTRYNATVKVSGNEARVTVNEGISWSENGAVGSGSVELPDYVIVPGEGQQGKDFELKDGEVVAINGNGKPVKDKFSFTIPEGSTAIVNLNNVHIQSYADYQNGIVIDGGGTVILKLNGTENTIENFVYGINNSGGEGSHICIEGPGTLKMKNLSVRPLTTTKSIKITSATLQFDYTSNSKYYVSACIGSAYNQTCGDITIIKSDIHINVKCPSKWYEKFGAAIGCGGGNEAGTEGGVCGNIDITLPEGISIEKFLDNINVLKEDGSALLNNDQKVGKGLYGKSCGTVTWRRSDGTVLETIPAH